MADLEIRAGGNLSAAGRVLEGYAAVFGSEARIADFRERIAPGAFRDSLSSGRDILCLRDHDPSALLGRTRSHTLELAEDEKGLHFRLQVPDTQSGRDLLALAERGDLGGMSFGFNALKDDWQGDLRTLEQVELHEVSVVQAYPAYAATSVSARSRRLPDINTLWLETCR